MTGVQTCALPILTLQAGCEQSQIWEKISLFWEKLRHLQPEVTGHDLLALGYKPGPHFQRALQAARDALLDGQIATKEEELALVRTILERDTALGKEPHLADQ